MQCTCLSSLHAFWHVKHFAPFFMSNPDWDLSVYCRIRWYKVLRPPPLYVGHRDPISLAGPGPPSTLRRLCLWVKTDDDDDGDDDDDDAMFAERCEANKWNSSCNSDRRIHLSPSRSDLSTSRGKRPLTSSLEFQAAISA